MNDAAPEGKGRGCNALLGARLWCLVWCSLGAYILIAAYGSSALKLAAGAFLTGFMVARNLADLASPPNDRTQPAPTAAQEHEDEQF